MDKFAGKYSIDDFTDEVHDAVKLQLGDHYAPDFAEKIVSDPDSKQQIEFQFRTLMHKDLQKYHGKLSQQNMLKSFASTCANNIIMCYDF